MSWAQVDFHECALHPYLAPQLLDGIGNVLVQFREKLRPVTLLAAIACTAALSILHCEGVVIGITVRPTARLEQLQTHSYSKRNPVDLLGSLLHGNAPAVSRVATLDAQLSTHRLGFVP